MLAVRREAWRFGREVRDGLVRDYERTYRCVAPAPALIADELLTDFLGARLCYDPLPLDRYAQTSFENGQPVVVINSLTADIPGVKDPVGVQNQAKLHETIHVVRDEDLLRVGAQGVFDGFEVDPIIRCYREAKDMHRSGLMEREFWAEEAGRAAAVSFKALLRSSAWLEFMGRDRMENSTAWKLLYEAAHDIGINATALVTQLGYEGYLTVDRRSSRSVVIRQPALGLLVREVA